MFPIILCIENRYSHFAASRMLTESGTFETVTATSAESAAVALQCIERIMAVVLAGEGNGPPEYIAISEALDEARPGIPKLIVAPPLQPPAPLESIARLHMSFVGDLEGLAKELPTVLALEWNECQETGKPLELPRKKPTLTPEWIDLAS